MAERRAVPGAIAEPIGQPPPRKSPDWSARTRDTISDAQRYTRFVVVMRRALLGAVIVLVGIVVAYSLMPRQQQRMAMTFEKMGNVAGDLAMIKPKLNGTDSNGNPFTVTADSAVQNSKNLRQATLRNVEADLTTEDGQWLNVTATHGALDSQARTLQLVGDISAFSDQGYEVHTDLAKVDLNKGTVIGPHHVKGQGPSGTFEADRFRIERLHDPCASGKKPQGAHAAKAKAKHAPGTASVVCPVTSSSAASQRSKPIIYLAGNVHMLIYPGAMKKP